MQPESTNTQNLDQYASSSLPFFDNNVMERFSVPPDYDPGLQIIDDGGNVIIDNDT